MTRGLIAIGLLIILVGLGGAGYGVWTIWQQHHMITSARPATARVIDHQTEDLKGGGFVAKVPLVKYEYTVDQKTYTSQTVTPAEFMLPDDWAESVFEQFPIGAEAQASYDPSDPAKAFLIAKYSVKPYLPLLISLVVVAFGVAVAGEQLLNQKGPATPATKPGAITLVATQHHLTRARVFGIMGLIGLICGVPAILHHLSVSTAPHERLGFLVEGAFAIAVLVVLGKSILQFRQGAGFGTPVVTIDRSPVIGQPLQVDVSVPTRFAGAASVTGRLKCEAKDSSPFGPSEEKPDTVLVDQKFLSHPPEPVTNAGRMMRTANLTIPDDSPPSTPVDSKEKAHVVWTLILTAEGSGGRKAETEYILSVLYAAS